MKLIKIILKMRINFLNWVDRQPCQTVTNGGLI